MDVLRALIIRLSVDIHHVIEAAGIVVLGLVFYSYARRWLDTHGRIDPRLRALVTGAIFGVLTIALMISRIEVGPGAFVDARALPIALITLVEGGGAGLVAALVACAYRISLGGAGAPAGVIGLLATAGAATLALVWARRSGGVRSRHGCVLGVAVYLITFASFALLGARGVELFKRDWLPLLFVSVVGIGGFTRLFVDVVSAQAAEAARRDAAELRAVNLLARAAAHEINNALMIVGWRARDPRPSASGRQRGRSVGGARARWCEHGQGHRHTHEHDHADRGSSRARRAVSDARHSPV